MSSTDAPQDAADRPARGVRAAVYNRFWHSMGGGERHNGMIAQVLASDGADVEILGHSDVDLDRLGSHLGLDLSGCRYVRLPDRGEQAIAALSADYDLFVNGSYMSRIAPESRRSAYLCFFPTPFDHDMAAWRKAAVRTAGPILRGVRPAISFGQGWYPPEGGRRRQWTWTNGSGILAVSPGDRRTLRADIGRPGAPSGTSLRVLDAAGGVLAKLEIGPDFAPFEVPLPPSADGTELTLVSDAFSPGEADVRELGVAVSRPRVTDGDEGPIARLPLRFPWLLRDPADLAYLDGYDVVMANSQFTRGWIRRLWKRDADVLFPPIQVDRLTPAPVREKAVITVGRFFAPGSGTRSASWRWSSGSASCPARGTCPAGRCTSSAVARTRRRPTWSRSGRPAPGCPCACTPTRRVPRWSGCCRQARCSGRRPATARTTDAAPGPPSTSA